MAVSSAPATRASRPSSNVAATPSLTTQRRTDAMSQVEAYLEAFETRAPKADARRAAIRRFGELGFPTRRQETWRFTNLRPLEQRFFPPAADVPVSSEISLPERARLDVPSWRFVLVNGAFAPLLSDLANLPAGTTLESGGGG